MSVKVIAINEFTALQQRFIMELCDPRWLTRTHSAIVDALKEEQEKLKNTISDNLADILDAKETIAEAYETLKKLNVIQEASFHTPHGVEVFYKLTWRNQ